MADALNELEARFMSKLRDMIRERENIIPQDVPMIELCNRLGISLEEGKVVARGLFRARLISIGISLNGYLIGMR